MKAFRTLILLLAILPSLSHAQSVLTRKENSRVDGGNVPGYQVTLTGTEEEVRSSLHRYLKNLGRTKEAEGIFTIAEPLIAGKKYSTPLHAVIKPLGNTTATWVGINAESGEESSFDRDLEKLIYDFGVTFYREKIQAQIDESLRALQAVEKQQTRLVNQNKDLNTKIENNKREKAQLEKSLVSNGLQLEDLTKKLEANKKAQDSVALATEQIRKAVEMHKEKQQKVH